MFPVNKAKWGRKLFFHRIIGEDILVVAGYLRGDMNLNEFAWKDGKKELGMLDFDNIVENVECTLTNIMEERKMGYSWKWQERFPITLRAV